jgi:tetratricopeptide (TPR) repeat protein
VVLTAVAGSDRVRGAESPEPAQTEETAADLYRRGLRSFRAGNLDESFALFRRSQQLDPAYPFPSLALGRIHQELFETRHRGYDDAAAAYERFALALEAAPPPDRERDLYQGLYFQGLLYLRGGEPAKALESLERFSAKYPGFYNAEEVLNARGVALYHLNRYEEAAKAFKEAIAAKPSLLEAKANLRAVFSRLALYDEARANYRSGSLDDALERTRSLRRIAPGYLPALRLEGEILERLGRPDEALCAYQAILEEDPGDPVTHGARLDIARLLEQRGENREALRILNENLRRFRDVPRDPTKREVLRLMNLLRSPP